LFRFELLDRSKIPRRDYEPTGEAESLVGKIDQKSMGTRVHREAPKKDASSSKKSKQSAAEIVERSVRRGAAGAGSGPAAGSYADILEAALDSEGVSYRPKTAETREVFELILGMVHRALGDQAADVVRSATDTILDILKADDLKDFDKKKEIEDIIGSLSSETFAQFVNLGKKITDWGEDAAAEGAGDAKREGEIDDDGIAVEFEGEDDDEDEDGQEFEIRDASDSEDGEEDDDDMEGVEGQDGGEDGGDELILGTDDTRSTKTKKTAPSDNISTHEIDAFYLQRLVAKSYPDPVTSADLTTKTLATLSSDYNLRDCENELMELFDYDKFDLVRILTKNREKLVWCTKLARSNEDERKDVEVAMREKGVGWILRELSGSRTAKSGAAMSGDAMEVDGEEPSKPSKPMATLAPGALGVQPRRTVDLNSMIFTEGAHLNSNRKPTLPKGLTTKVSYKGYDQITIKPPPKKEVAEGDLVNIHDLPTWTHEAFGTESKRLNPIQSKAYPIAFGTDEPILLCAPTGAGKVSVSLVFLLLITEQRADVFLSITCRPTSPSSPSSERSTASGTSRRA
jgi:pre-mRNA-splicing helicase BRR2